MGRLFGGHCRLCDEDWKGQGITSHVKRCLAEHANQAAIHHGLLVGARADGPAGRYWTYLLVRPEAALTALDEHLRELWFADEDAPAAFDVEGTRYADADILTATDDETPTESLDANIGATIRPRMEFTYFIDPHRPTEVEMTVYDPFPCPAALVPEDSEGNVVTIARSQMGETECSTCGAPAEFFCLACQIEEDRPDEPEATEEDGEEETEDGDEAAFLGDSADDQAPEPTDDLGPFACADCRHKHDSPLVAIVDSPRMGADVDLPEE